jgi:hypothetical protein
MEHRRTPFAAQALGLKQRASLSPRPQRKETIMVTILQEKPDAESKPAAHVKAAILHRLIALADRLETSRYPANRREDNITDLRRDEYDLRTAILACVKDFPSRPDFEDWLDREAPQIAAMDPGRDNPPPTSIEPPRYSKYRPYGLIEIILPEFDYAELLREFDPFEPNDAISVAWRQATNEERMQFYNHFSSDIWALIEGMA